MGEKYTFEREVFEQKQQVNFNWNCSSKNSSNCLEKWGKKKKRSAPVISL